MTLLDKIRLSRKFGTTTYVISSILTVAMAMLVVFEPTAVGLCVLFKLFSIPVICYLRSTLETSLKIYFYINLGISRREYLFIPAVVEFLAFVVIMIITGVIGYAIG